MTEPAALAVLFADICDSTRLYHVLGDATAHEMATRCLKLITTATKLGGGTVVKTIGDGAMCTFPTADQAYRAAINVQDGLRGGVLKVKIGVHLGPVIVTDGDVFGDTVNLAARMLEHSGPGEILMTGALVENLRPQHREMVALVDTTSVKGRPESVEMYRVVTDTEGDSKTIIVKSSTKTVESALAVVLKHRDKEIRLELTGAPVLIGRDAACNIVIRNDMASRQHATIDVQHNRFVLRDHSSNGTFVEDRTGKQQFLKRESAPLALDGTISAGIVPDKNPDDVIHYRCEP